ncbi:MAG: hypothetical protein IKK82_11600 [Kiritimatiellae bacterium]|nr:hypothetical protein [Kiritimatiellia bacterium]
MTHFAVAVISDGAKTVDELLAPYQENNMGTCPREYLEFFDEEDEYLLKYEHDSVEMVKMPDGRMLYPWDEEFRKDGEFGYGSGTHEVPADAPLIKVPFKEKYETFEQFMADWHGMPERNPETDRYGYFENPNAKWDWYQIGGRWRGMLRATEGELGEPSWCNEEKDLPAGRFDIAKIGDIDFTRNQEIYDRAIAEWEFNVEGKGDDESLRWWCSTDYMVKHYGNKEAFAKVESTLFWRAVITPDGQWHEVGEMGWFGCSSESGDEYADWALHFKERFIDPCDPEYILHVVDCHI